MSPVRDHKITFMSVTDAAFHVCPNFVLKVNTVGEIVQSEKNK